MAFFVTKPKNKLMKMSLSEGFSGAFFPRPMKAFANQFVDFFLGPLRKMPLGEIGSDHDSRTF